MTLVHVYYIMLLLWPERKLLARIVFNFVSNTVGLSSFSLQWPLYHRSSTRVRMRSSLSTNSPSSFQFAILSGFAMFRTKVVLISKFTVHLCDNFTCVLHCTGCLRMFFVCEQ